MKIEKNWSYKITDKNHPKFGKTLWSGRYCAVTGIVNYYDEKTDKFWFLITKRGSGAADFQGKWCLPCGFLEANETAEEGVAREVYEETGIILKRMPKFDSVETNPEFCNNGNVTLRYVCDVDEMETPHYKCTNGEANEVAELKWISEDEIDNYDFCFNHEDILNMFIYYIKLDFSDNGKTENLYQKIKHRFEYKWKPVKK